MAKGFCRYDFLREERDQSEWSGEMGMELRALSKNYAVRALDSKDLAAIYALSCKNELYYQYHPPFVTRESIIEDMKALPPGKTYEDKYYIGFFEGDVLVAMMDLI